MQSCLRWAGSKRQLLPELKALYGGHSGRYVEPFCGSACLFFALQPTEAVLGDLNFELINAFRILQLKSSVVAECLRRLPVSKEAYYLIRAQDPNGLAEAERAARFLYLNRYCFNGIYRTNTAGKFNVPFGPQKTVTAFPTASLNDVSVALRGAFLVHGDFERTLSHVRAGDFVYVDPPYASESRRIFNEYGPTPFSSEDLSRLSLQLNRIDTLGAKFVLSYTETKEAKALFAMWSPRRVWVKRNVAGFASDRRGAYELLATNLSEDES
jgi:DNA adenine methylase